MTRILVVNSNTTDAVTARIGAAARAASLTNGGAAATGAADRAARDTLAGLGLTCTGLDTAVDTSRFRAGGQVAVALTAGAGWPASADSKETLIPSGSASTPTVLVFNMMLSKRWALNFCQTLTASRFAPCIRPSIISTTSMRAPSVE